MIKRDRIAAVLAYLNAKVDNEKHRTGWVISTCPFARWTHEQGVDRNPSFGVSTNESSNIGERRHRAQVYHCFSCQKTGIFEDLPFNLRELYRADPKGERPAYGKALEIIVAEEEDDIDFDGIPDFDEPMIDPDEVIAWPEFYLESFRSVFAFERAVDYLQTRQITERVAQVLDLRFDTSRDRVCFPIRDFDSRLVGLHGRTISDHPMPYYAYGYENRRNRLPWLGEQWFNLDKTVLLVESVFDLASVRRVYNNAACGLSSGLSDAKIKRIDGAVQYVTLYDHGTGGDRARERLDAVLGKGIRHLIPTKAQGDPGNMTEEELFKTLAGALVFDN
jgi:hypothetical protein